MISNSHLKIIGITGIRRSGKTSILIMLQQELIKEGENAADFVIRGGLSIKEVIQVAYELNSEKTKDREVRGLVACAKEAGLKHGLIIIKDFEKVETVDGIKIIFMPLWKWLLKM